MTWGIWCEDPTGKESGWSIDDDAGRVLTRFNTREQAQEAIDRTTFLTPEWKYTVREFSPADEVAMVEDVWPENEAERALKKLREAIEPLRYHHNMTENELRDCVTRLWIISQEKTS